jgi:hypothetical protein
MMSRYVPLCWSRVKKFSPCLKREAAAADDSGGELTELHLKRLHGDYRSKWLYVVGLAPGARSANAPSDSFFADINLSGEAAVVV